MVGYVTVKQITDTHIYRAIGSWVKVSKSWQIALRPTKGWHKLSPVKTRTERAPHLPPGWKRGFTRTITDAR